MDWTDISITLPVAGLEQASDIAQLVATGGIYIEDYSDLATEAPKIAHIDLIDEDLLSRDPNVAVIHIYISPDENAQETMDFLSESLTREELVFALDCQPVREEDWANAWKDYYHPQELSTRLAICPSWESYTPKPGQRVIHLDPGMAFGTGTHETTRLCLGLLEESVAMGSSILDIGTGSGILAIGARLLGSGHTVAIDIDPMAVRVAGENASLNGITDINFLCGDLAEQINERFDIICANIVADVIIRLAPSIPALLKRGGVFIASGIIEQRAPEVVNALSEVGFTAGKTLTAGGWTAITFSERG